MIEPDRVSVALEEQVPLRADRAPDWSDVVGRAALGRRARGRRVLTAGAVALALVVVASALAAAGRGPFGEISSWLNGEPGEPASPAEQAGFAERNGASYVSFPHDTELRRLVQTTAGGMRFTLLGFTSKGSLCLRLVQADLPAARGSNECVTRAELDSSPAPALVAATAWLPNGASRGLVNGMYGFADDTVEAIEYRRGRGAWTSVPVANNVFLALAGRPAGAARNQPAAILQVRAVTRPGTRVAVPFFSAFTSLAGGLPSGPGYLTMRADEYPGPQAVAAPYRGGTIDWLVRGEKRGRAWQPAPMPARSTRRREPVVFSRSIQPDPDDPLRLGLFLIRAGADSRMGTGPGSLLLCMSQLEPLVDTAGWWCKPTRTGRLLFTREPFSLSFGYGGSEQRRRLVGAAADDVAAMRLFLSSGRVVPVALHDNAYSVSAPFDQFPAALAAYDDAGRVIGLQRLPGLPHVTPCPALSVWPAAKLPPTRSYQRLDLGALTLDGAPILGRSPAEVEAALGTPDRRTTAALKNRSPEQRFFYGGRLPSAAELTVHFGSYDGRLLADQLAFTGRGLVDPKLGHVLNTKPAALQTAIGAAYGDRLRVTLDVKAVPRFFGQQGCASELRSKRGGVRVLFGVVPNGARPFLTISRRPALASRD